jgi:hypothetical protein
MEDNFKYYGMYRAKVLGTDVLEDDKIGRLKLEIYPMLISSDTNGSAIRLKAEGNNIDGIALADLPWAAPAMNLFIGSGDGFGNFAMPSVGSFVWTFFEGGDIYQPVYFAEATTKTLGLPVERLTNYPTRKVLKTENGIVIEIDDTLDSEEIKITHPAGTIIQVDSTGNISITSAGTTNIVSSGNLSVTAPRIDLN